jgi:hypothetical protein
MEEARNFPTMIIPKGTNIAVNEQGQLSIRTPGNLVIQNSGVYSVIESGSGSVRIDPEVKVEAVSIQAADSCFVAGELTAWRVRARKITLERGAQANIMLQESESLELDRNSRLVGNFASEKELYLMLGRFSRQLRELPDNLNRKEREQAQIAAETGTAGALDTSAEGESEGPFEMEVESTAASTRQQDEVLSLARKILEREIGRPSNSGAGRKALERLLEMVRSKDLDGLRQGFKYQLSQVDDPSDELEKVTEMLAKLLGESRKPEKAEA